MLRSTKVAGVHHTAGQQRRQKRVVMVIWIPWAPLLIYSLHKSVSCPLAVFFFYSLTVSHFILLSLSYHLCSIFFSYTLHFSSRLSLASSSFSKCLLLFPYFFLFLIPSPFPLSPWSSPLVQSSREGEAEEGRNSNFISTETEWRKDRERKCHSS